MVGAGPAGLAAAMFMSRAGVPVTVFERRDRPGGVVAHAMTHSGDDRTRTIGLVAELGLLAYNEASAGADLRAWGALPKRVFAGRVPRPADGVLRLDAASGRQYRVPLPPGSSMVLFRVPTATAQPAAFVIGFPEAR